MKSIVPLLLGLLVWAGPERASAQEAGPVAESPAAPSPHEWAGPVSPSEQKIGAALRESRRRAPGEQGELVDRIVALDVEAVPACLAILVQGRVPKAETSDAPQKLSVPQKELVLAALAKLPEREVRRTAEKLASLKLDEPLARTTVELFGAIGTARDVTRLAAWLPRSEDKSLPRASRDVLRAAYARILARDDASFDPLAALATGRDEVVADQVLRAFADRRDPRALRPLFEVARTRPTLARTAVALMTRCAGSEDPDLRYEVATWLRSVIDEQRVEWTRSVFAALAVFDEGDALFDLVAALESGEDALRGAAHMALQKLARVALPPDPEAWSRFYDQELAWFSTERPRLNEMLASNDPETVVEALRGFSEHHLFGSVLSQDLMPLLAHPNPAFRVLACTALTTLRSPRSFPALEAACDDPVPGVAEAARAALESIRGAGRPAAPVASAPAPAPSPEESAEQEPAPESPGEFQDP